MGQAHNLLGCLELDTLAHSRDGTAEVRREERPLVCTQPRSHLARPVWQGPILKLEHIGSVATEDAGVERVGDGLLAHARASRDVDEQKARLGLPQPHAVEQVLRTAREWSADDKHVAYCEKLLNTASDMTRTE